MYAEKFQNKYRIKSTRLPEWDYSWNGYYFITICTKDQACYFGDVVDEKMVFSDMGKIVFNEWQNNETVRTNVKLDEWIVMPNHLHGIIIINNGNDFGTGNVDTPRRGVSTVKKRNRHHNLQWKSNSLGSIVNQFKGACTKQIRKKYLPNFAWQPRYYDHIVRNEGSLNRIRLYIADNPKNWNQDRNTPADL